MMSMFSRYLKSLGPGLTTGAADDDPSGIATYSQAGAHYGYQFLWLSLFTFPLMAIVQEMCARIGMVTGRGLAANIRMHYPRPVLYVVAFLLFAANTFNLGADLGAMAKATQLVIPSAGFVGLVLGFALISGVVQIYTTYGEYARYLKYLTLVLFAYVAAAFLSDIDWSAALAHTLTPSFAVSTDAIFLVVAVLGTTISPYLFFWQTSQEVEEDILHGNHTIAQRRASTTTESIRAMRFDVWSGMFLSNVVMFFIIVTCAAELFQHGITTVATADQAAAALRPVAGEAAYLLFSLGILGTGFLAVPVLAGSAAYAVAETFRWHEGLYRRFRDARGFYTIIVLSTGLGAAFSLGGIDPIKALLWSAALNGIIAPVILYFVVALSGRHAVMGVHGNNRIERVLGWGIVFLLSLASIAALWALL